MIRRNQVIADREHFEVLVVDRIYSHEFELTDAYFCVAAQGREGSLALIDQTRLERIALRALATSEGPVGASRLVGVFSQHDIDLSEATVGRFLRALDRRGWTHPVGKLGRLLTEDGRDRLRQLEVMQRQDEQSAVLIGAATPIDVHELIDLLYTRRAIEPEAARHAALRATDEERQAIRDAANAHFHYVMEGEAGTEPAAAALDFHRLVASASHNKMLAALASLTLDSSNAPLSALLDSISTEAGAQFAFAHEHRSIIDAITARDAAAAEEAMREHLDDLIKVVRGYSQRHPRFSASMELALTRNSISI